MVPLATTLTAHQKLTNRVPALSVTATPTRFGSPVLRWTRLYTGSEADAPHALAVPGDGSLVRVQNNAGSLQVQRVANPSGGPGFATWTTLETVTAGAPVAAAADS